MQIKVARFLPVGINQDLADSRFNPQFLYDAYNIRFMAADSNTSLIIENERGNKLIELTDDNTISGKVVGYCICDRDLIIFTTDNLGDYIYKLTADEENKFSLTTIWSGSGLNLDINHPIDALYSYETESIRKVYFVDGKNTAKYFNIENPPTDINEFEFSPNITGDETITVEKLDGGGQFTAGTIQYTFSYYSVNGAETSLVDISSLEYPSFSDRAGKEGEVVDSSFKITLSNLDYTRYQYVRIYTIEHTSLDTEPKVRRIDASISSSTLTIIDDGVIGYSSDPNQLLFVGGESLIIGTIAAKDGTLFAGNITLNSPSLKDFDFNPLRVTWKYDTVREIIESTQNSEDSLYIYKPFLSKKKYFKNRQLYRFGIQIQYKNGKWSEIKYIGNDTTCNKGLQMSNTMTSTQKIYGYLPNYAEFTLTSDLVDQLLAITNNNILKIRPVMVPVAKSDKNVLAQGVISNTIFNLKERLNGSVIGYSDYMFRLTNPYNRESDGLIITKETSQYYSYAAKAVHQHYAELPFSNLDESAGLPLVEAWELGISHGQKPLTHGLIGSGSVIDPYKLSYDLSNEATAILWNIDRSIVDFWSPELQYNIEDLLPDEMRIVGLQEALSVRDKLEYIDVVTTGDYVHPYTGSNLNETSDYSIPIQLKTITDRKTPNRQIIPSMRKYVLGHPDSSSGPTDQWARLALWNPMQVTAGGGNGTSEGNIKITKKSQGRLLYLGNIMPTVEPDSETFLHKISSVVTSRLDTTSSDISSVPFTFKEESATYSAGMNKILTSFNIDNPIQYQVYIRYKTASHLTFGITDPYGSVVTPYPDLNSGISQTTYYNNPVTSNTALNVPLEINSHFTGTTNVNTTGYAYLVDLIKDRTTETGSSQFGGSELKQITYNGESSSISTLVATEASLLNNTWIPCGPSVKLVAGQPVTIKCTEGDTFLQRYDCVRVEPIQTVNEDGTITVDSENNYQSRTEVVSFLCETQINLDGRWDRNRYQTDVRNISSANYGLVNLAYSQTNNFFNYKVLDYRILKEDKFPVSFIWSTQKIAGEIVDPWTSLSTASISDASGVYGPIRKIITYNNELFGFQDKGIFNILFNNRVQIPTSDEMPIEITNNYKVQGVRYLSNTKGTLDKLSVGISPRAIYFVDNYNKTISRFTINGGIQDISLNKGMRSWTFNNIIDSETSSYIDAVNLNVMVDAINNDVYFINKEICLCFNESIEAFTGFYSYENVPFIVNVAGDIISLNPLDSAPYLQQSGRYNEFFGNRIKSYVTYKINPDPFLHKIFNNVAFVCDCFNIPESMDRITENRQLRIVEQDTDPNNRIIETLADLNTYGNPELIYAPNRCLDYMEVWTEYQSNATDLVYKESPSNLQKKFRVWRANIPRSHNSRQRINNPWMNLRLSLNQSEDENIRMLLHNLEVFYTV